MQILWHNALLNDFILSLWIQKILCVAIHDKTHEGKWLVVVVKEQIRMRTEIT